MARFDFPLPSLASIFLNLRKRLCDFLLGFETGHAGRLVNFTRVDSERSVAILIRSFQLEEPEWRRRRASDMNREDKARESFLHEPPMTMERQSSITSVATAPAGPPSNELSFHRRQPVRGKTLPILRNRKLFVSPTPYDEAADPPSPSGATFVTPQEHDVGMTLASLRERDIPSTKVTTNPAIPSEGLLALTFPQTVHAMVTATARSNPEIIDWIEDGEAFVVNDKGILLGQVLERYFRHNKYSSLQRQLNMYGWKKHVGGRFAGAFHHPCFHRDCGDSTELLSIRRNGPPVPPKQKPLKRRSSSRILKRTGLKDTTNTRPPKDVGDLEAPAKKQATDRCLSQRARPMRIKKPPERLMMMEDTENMDEESQGEAKRPTKPTKPLVALPASSLTPVRNSRYQSGIVTEASRVPPFVTKRSIEETQTPNKAFGDPHMVNQWAEPSLNFDHYLAGMPECWSPLITGKTPDDSKEKRRNLGKHSALSTIATPEVAPSTSHSRSVRITLFNGRSCLSSPAMAPIKRETDQLQKESDETIREAKTPSALVGSAEVPDASGQRIGCPHPGWKHDDVPETLNERTEATNSVLTVNAGNGLLGPVQQEVNQDVPQPPPFPSRRTSSSSFAPMPLMRNSSSSFFLPFVGMTSALSHALGVTNDERSGSCGRGNTKADTPDSKIG